MRKALRITLVVLGIIIFVALAGFVIWGVTPSGPMPEATNALLSGSQVTVTKTDVGLVFTPTASQPTTGLIIYPGGHVDYRAYAPTASQIAAQGYLVVIVPMPLNLAVLNAGAAADVIIAYPEIEHWAVGGHSLGGAMAANFAKKNPEQVNGLVLWAAYPASSDDLTASGLRVASIYGALDGLATGEDIEASRSLLPADTTWVPIDGGNHAQNGWYGAQSGDNPATISRQQQQDQIVAATVALLASL